VISLRILTCSGDKVQLVVFAGLVGFGAGFGRGPVACLV
jgi:hypothetical protein